MKNIVKIFLYAILYFISIFFLQIKIFNRYCDLTDTFGYNYITDFVRFFSNNFILIANIIMICVLAIILFKKLKNSKHL